MNIRRVVVPLLAAVLLAGGCAQVPTDGTVRSGGGAGDQIGDSRFGIAVQAPRPGAGARSIVNDFLDAMAVSSATDIARQFLTAQAAAAWQPDRKVAVFDRSLRRSITENGLPSGGIDVVLDAPELATLDERGVYQSAAPGKRTAFVFELVRVGGELRIAKAPDGRLIAQDLFLSRYTARNLYFFTPSTDAVVPDAVYVPEQGTNARSATLLAQALLAGPTRRLGDSVQTVVPKGTEVASVTVDADGVATVSLNDRPVDLGPDLRFKLAAQLAWTLRQVPGVLKLKITAGGQPLEVDGTTTELPVSRWDSYDAAFASQTGRQLYLLNGREIGRMNNVDAATGQPPQYQRGEGLQSPQSLEKESVAIDLDGRTMAAVSGDTVVVGAIGAQGQPGPARVATEGTVLRPSFDKDRNLWIVDRADSGTPRIRVRREDGRLLDVVASSLAGQRLTAFRIARDGVRVLVVVRSGNRSRLMVGRISGNGDPVTLSGLQTMQLGCAEISDVGWSRPMKIVVLCKGSDSTGYQPLEVNVDGSEPTEILGNGVQDFSPNALASAPDTDALLTVRNADGKVLVRQRDLTWLPLTHAGYPVYPG